MKRISAEAPPLIPYRSITTFLLLITLSSCSWISSRRSLFGDEEEKGERPAATIKTAPAVEGTVSRAEYEMLKKKYEALANERKGISKPEPTFKNDGFEDPSDLVDQLNKVSTQPELAETVDVFGRDGLATNTPGTRKTPAPIIPGAIKKSKVYSSSEVENQIQELRKAQSLMAQNRFDATLKIVKRLENSSIKQVRVRAKFIFGELLFAQQEYDLAMQVYEEIIRREAFSGVVIKALGRLVVCSEKLKLAKKQEQYYSLLNDILGSI